jgi:prolyl-tRNA synthetase
VTETLNVPASKLVKTLIYKSNDEYIAVLVRGDKTINESKLRKALGRTSLKLADNKEIEKLTNAPVGYSGPVGLKKVRIIADYQVENMSNFVTGANEKDRHFVNVNIGRDFKIDNYFDLRYINEEDACPICNKKIQIKSVMEIGHVFKLGTRYSKQLKANYLDKDGQEKPLVMGCYGIGVNRLLAAIIELNHDKEGIKWPISCAPFEVLILPLDKEADKVAEDIYNKLEKEDIAVLLDDRNMQAGVKFKDADLIGIPIQIILGSKNLKKDKVEIKLRASKERQLIDKKDVISYSKKILTM